MSDDVLNDLIATEDYLNDDGGVDEPSAVISVPVGNPAQTFSIGDLLNAVDSVVCYFRSMREQTDAEIAGALRLYADKFGAANAPAHLQGRSEAEDM